MPLRRQDEIRAVRHILAIEGMREPPSIPFGCGAIPPEKCHFKTSWYCETLRVQRPDHIVRMVVNHVKLPQQPVQHGEHQIESDFVDEPIQGMQLYDNNSKPFQNFFTDVQEYVPFRP